MQNLKCRHFNDMDTYIYKNNKFFMISLFFCIFLTPQQGNFLICIKYIIMPVINCMYMYMQLNNSQTSTEPPFQQCLCRIGNINISYTFLSRGLTLDLKYQVAVQNKDKGIKKMTKNKLKNFASLDSRLEPKYYLLEIIFKQFSEFFQFS